MKISKELPPNYNKIKEVFDIEGKPIVFTWGDTIYNVPEGYEVPTHLEIHESIHWKQQGEKPDEWWEKYIKDKEFRMEQELEAYACQYKFVKNTQKRKVSDMFLDSIAHDLASEVYGNLLSFNQAQTKIRRLTNELK